MCLGLRRGRLGNTPLSTASSPRLVADVAPPGIGSACTRYTGIALLLDARLVTSGNEIAARQWRAATASNSSEHNFS